MQINSIKVGNFTGKKSKHEYHANYGKNESKRNLGEKILLASLGVLATGGMIYLLRNRNKAGKTITLNNTDVARIGDTLRKNPKTVVEKAEKTIILNNADVTHIGDILRENPETVVEKYNIKLRSVKDINFLAGRGINVPEEMTLEQVKEFLARYGKMNVENFDSLENIKINGKIIKIVK